MIIVDIETTGLDPKRNCMVSLGAVDYDTGKTFYGECCVYLDTVIDPVAMEINGFKAEDLKGTSQDRHKQTPGVLYYNFVKWAEQFPDKTLAGHNIGHFDLLFLEHYAKDFKGSFPFGYRTVDLHSVAYVVFRKSLSHEKICTVLGLPVEPKPHNALQGALSECAAFRMLFERFSTTRWDRPRESDPARESYVLLDDPKQMALPIVLSGYRRLADGETLQEGDEYWSENNQMWKRTIDAGTILTPEDMTYRRKLD